MQYSRTNKDDPLYAIPHYNTVNAEILEQQNETLIQGSLSDATNRLKKIAYEIHDEVVWQNDAMEDMMTVQFGDAQDGLKQSTQGIQTMLSTTGLNKAHMTAMVSFSVSALCFLWWLL